MRLAPERMKPRLTWTLQAVCLLLFTPAAWADEFSFDESESLPIVRGENESSARDAGGLIEIRYNPPDGLQFEERVNRVVGSDYGERGMRIDTFSAVNHQKVRKMDGAYEVLMTIQRLGASLNGKPLQNPFLEAMKGVKLVYRIGDAPGGHVMAHGISGIDKVAENLRAGLPKGKPPPVEEEALQSEIMEKREMTDWNARYGSWHNQYFVPGKVYYQIGTYTLEPGLFIRYGIAAKVVPGVSCHGGDSEQSCIRIRYDLGTEPELVEKARKASIRHAMEFLKHGDVVGGQIEGYMERTIDPRTLMIYGELHKKTILFPLSVDEGEVIRVRRIERVEYTYRYDHMPSGLSQVASSPN